MVAGRRLVAHAWRWSMIYSIRPKTQPAPAPGSPHSLYWVTLSGEQRAGELPLQMSGWRAAAAGGGGGGDTWTHTRHTKTSSQWCGTVVHTAQHATSTSTNQAHNLQTFIQSSLLSAAITITAAARAVRPPNTTDMSYNLPTRAGNEPSHCLKFYNHGEGH